MVNTKENYLHLRAAVTDSTFSRKTIPAAKRKEFERSTPLAGWGFCRVRKPGYDELILGQLRNTASPLPLCAAKALSPVLHFRLAASENVADWSDDRFWEALKQRLPQFRWPAH